MSTPSRFQRWARPLLTGRLGQAEEPEPEPDPEDPTDYAHEDNGGSIQVAVGVTTTGELVEGETVTTDGDGPVPANPSNANDRDPQSDSGISPGVEVGTKVIHWACDFGLAVEVTGMRVWDPLGADQWTFNASAVIEHSDDGSSWTPASFAYTTANVPNGLSFPLATTSLEHRYELDTPSTHRYWRIGGSFSGLHGFKGMAEWFVDGSLVSDQTWTAAAAANDGDDSTYAESDALIDGATARIFLDTERLIYRAEVRIACEDAGSRTYSIYGSDDALFTSPVLLDSVTFTALGSFTAQDIVLSWLPEATYQYYEIRGDDETRRFHDINLFSAVNAGFGVTEHPALDGRDEADQHPASSISLSPTVAGESDVQAALEALEAGFSSSVVVDHGSMGATETVDVSVSAWHTGTLNTDCAITVSGFTVDLGLVVVFEVAQDGTGGHGITWDGDVSFFGDDQPDLTATSTTIFMLWSSAGDTTIYAGRIGGSASALTVEDEGTPLATAATTLDFVGAGVTASGTGATKTITIPGGSDPVDDTAAWMPLTTVDGGEPVLVWDGDDSLIPTLVPL